MWAWAAAARPERKPRFGRGPPLQGDFVRRVVPRPAPTRGRGTSMYRSDEIPLHRRPSRPWRSSLRRDISFGMPEPASTKPRTFMWRKTRRCGDRAQAGHGWPALACWSQGRRNQAMRPIPAPPRLPPEGDKSRRFGSTQKPALPRLPPKPTDSSALRPHPENRPIMAAGPHPLESPP